MTTYRLTGMPLPARVVREIMAPHMTEDDWTRVWQCVVDYLTSRGLTPTGGLTWYDSPHGWVVDAPVTVTGDLEADPLPETARLTQIPETPSDPVTGLRDIIMSLSDRITMLAEAMDRLRTSMDRLRRRS